MGEHRVTRYVEAMESPIGPLLIVVDAEGAVNRIAFGGVDLAGARERLGREHGVLRHDASRTTPAVRQLAEYFDSTRRTFDLALAPAGTPFQRRVWEELRHIPYGTTTTYGALAGRIGKPTASRAVGAANGANPIPIVVPCHRVIGSAGTLVGFGGGLEVKAALLALESGQVAWLDLLASGTGRRALRVHR